MWMTSGVNKTALAKEPKATWIEGWSEVRDDRCQGRCKTSAHFVDKTRDIVGLYVDPPQHAMVLCVDEKSLVQVLDRTQPLLPLRPGQVERAPMTTSAMARPRCSLPLTLPPARSSDNATGAIAAPSSAGS